MRRTSGFGVRLGLLAALATGGIGSAGSVGSVDAAAARGSAETPRFPNVLLITVDTLRADRLSGAGYARPTTPNLDLLLGAGTRFTGARTIEPLTSPALTSLLTSLPPHLHGATRNGIPVRPGLASWPRILARRGYRTAAFVGNWTLQERLSGLEEHFGTYEVITSRKRWFGILRGEATAEDLNAAALEWLEKQRRSEPERPVLLWLHYVEPHAPYRFQEAAGERIGVRRSGAGELAREDRYDTEVAFVDGEVGKLLAGWRALVPDSTTLTIMTADHGENLGEHGYWGHGRHLWEENLRVPFGIVWPGRVPRQTLDEEVTHLDLGPTLLGLFGLPPLPVFQGRDLSGRITRGAPVPSGRTCFQAHSGAVQSVQDAQRARRRGLLEVGVVAGRRKEVVRSASGHVSVYDLDADAREGGPARPAAPSPALQACLDEVRAGLVAADELPAPPVDPETLEQLRALGYID